MCANDSLLLVLDRCTNKLAHAECSASQSAIAPAHFVYRAIEDDIRTLRIDWKQLTEHFLAANSNEHSASSQQD
jgi:hypothetical protein